MRVVGATFSRREKAEQVLEELRSRFDLRQSDAAVAPLGVTGDREDATVLAGRFQDDCVALVRELIERCGGSIAVEIDEQATKRWIGPMSTRAAGSELGGRPH